MTGAGRAGLASESPGRQMQRLAHPQKLEASEAACSAPEEPSSHVLSRVSQGAGVGGTPPTKGRPAQGVVL